MIDDDQSLQPIEGEILDDNDLVLYNGNRLHEAGKAANVQASQGVFGDYISRKAKNTIIRQRSDLALFSVYLADALGNISAAPSGEALQQDPTVWSGITWGIVEGFKRWLLQHGYAVSSVNIRLSTIKTYARLSSKAGTIPPNEFVLIKAVEGYRRVEAKHLDERREIRRKGPKKAQSVSLTLEQAKALKSQPDTSQGRRDALLMSLLLDHGLRCGEVARLSVADIDLRDGMMHFYRPKVDKIQTHKLTSDTLRAAYAWLLSGDAPKAGPLLRASQKGGDLTSIGMTERGITKRVRTLGAALGIFGLSAHDCRHFWATHAARSGTDAFTLQEAGGWSSLAMPRRYVEAAAVANERVKGF
jgi:integrase